ncbi:hypothetical protein HKCCE3408_12980 [Rhodobacterales bacterium HKCCE3408]|nr:hypothetical protein [Rhodobacterales bacterium HKCCE3408]
MSRNLLTLPILLLLLAGCGMIGGGPGDRAVVTADAVAIEGPAGFCVDPDATRDEGTTAFVLMGNCAALSPSPFTRQPANPAVLTATVSARGGTSIAASIDELPEFFASTDGRRLLSRAGDPDAVDLIQNFAEGPVFYLKARDRSPGQVPGVRDDQWRAYLDVGPRIVALSVLALRDSGLDDAGSLALLRRFVALVQAANPQDTVAGDDGATPAAPEPRGLFNSGFFRRILDGTG